MTASAWLRRLLTGSLLLVVAGWYVPSACAQARRQTPAPSAAAAPSDAERLQQAIGLYGTARYPEAEAMLRTIPGAEAAAYLAASLVRQKKYAEAEAPGIAALTADPVHALAAAALGEALVVQKKHDDAVSRLSAVLTAKPEVAYAYYWRGHAYYAKKMPDKMVVDFNAFLTLAPNAPEAQTVRSLLASLR